MRRPSGGQVIASHQWVLLSEAINFVCNYFSLTEKVAAQMLVDGARTGALYTRGRIHYPTNDPPFLLNPLAWGGMHADLVASQLIPPHQSFPEKLAGGSSETVQIISMAIPEAQLPFLNSPLVTGVQIHGRSFTAWLNDRPTPEAPPMPVLSDGQRSVLGLLLWSDMPQKPTTSDGLEARGTLINVVPTSQGSENRRRKLNTAIDVLKTLWPEEEPSIKREEMLAQVNAELTNRKIEQVSPKTLQRAIKANWPTS